MTSWSKIFRVQIYWPILKNFGLIAIGSVICALAINGVLIPNQFLSGGFTGLALVIYYLTPSVPVGWLYFLLNVPLFAIGWKYVGPRFFWYSLVGAIIFSASLKWVNFTIPVQDEMLSALLGGIISGIGAGIILKSLGSAGGLDILSVILLRRFSVRLGSTQLALNGIIIAGGALVFSLERALYTLVYVYVTSRMLNLVMTGLSQRKAVFIISPRWQEISKEIIEKINRGVTILHGRGGYTGQEEKIVYSVITFRELPRLKEIIRQLDPNAFVVFTETLEVMGARIGNQPHW